MDLQEKVFIFFNFPYRDKETLVQYEQGVKCKIDFYKNINKFANIEFSDFCLQQIH